MKLIKYKGLKFKITFIVLIILITICFMLTYTSICKNKGNTSLAISTLEDSALEMEKVIASENISSNIIDKQIDNENIYSYEINKEENISSSSTFSSEFIAEEAEPSIKITELAVQLEPIHSTLVQSQINFRNMQLSFMIIMIFLGGTITYIFISKFLTPLTKMTNVIENINHNNLNEEIQLPKQKDEIYRLSKSFNEMLSRIRKSFELEKNFSASASHELKTPLAIMKSSIQVLRLSDKPTIEEYEESINIIEKNVENLIDIVNNLLLLTSNDIGLFEKVNVLEITNNIISSYNTDLYKRKIIIENNLKPMFINSNKALIKCILENIITNAIKYNKENGKIIINALEEEEHFTFTIEDTGIGISKKNIQNVFNPFYREDESRCNEIKGNGLGLSLVKNIIDKINGNIFIESEKNIGTKVTFFLKK